MIYALIIVKDFYCTYFAITKTMPIDVRTVPIDHLRNTLNCLWTSVPHHFYFRSYCFYFVDSSEWNITDFL